MSKYRAQNITAILLYCFPYFTLHNSNPAGSSAKRARSYRTIKIQNQIPGAVGSDYAKLRRHEPQWPSGTNVPSGLGGGADGPPTHRQAWPRPLARRECPRTDHAVQ